MVLTSVLRDLLSRRRRDDSPSLSIVANFYNNRREARNTLFSLTRQYQLDSSNIPYEVIAVDNGSPAPLSEPDVQTFGPEFHHQFFETSSPSPAAALNEACRSAAGEHLLVMVDGAHILTPGVLRMTRDAFHRYPRAFLAMPLLHLGPSLQNLSVQDGYTQEVEDNLLNDCRWRENGYRLYSISGSFADDSGGWFGQLYESGCFGIRKDDFLALGGLDERFQSPGGGLVSLDLFQRALATPELTYVMLLGEATFHQVHGGVATNAALVAHPWKAFHDEFIRIRGHPFARVPRKPVILGEPPHEAAGAVARSRELGEAIWARNAVTSK